MFMIKNNNHTYILLFVTCIILDCYDRKDIIFVVDSSADVERIGGLANIQTFLINVLSGLRVDLSTTRVGVLMYGDDIDTSDEYYFKLDDSRDANYVINAIRRMRTRGGEYT